MKRLGETAVSPDGKWLAYSVTTVDLDQNTKTAELLAFNPSPAASLQSLPVGSPVTVARSSRRRQALSLFPDGSGRRYGLQTSTPPPAPPAIRGNSPTSPPGLTTRVGRPTATRSSSPRRSILTAPRSEADDNGPATDVQRRRDKAARRARSRRRSSRISSIATGTTSPATSVPISFWSTSRAANSATSRPTIPTTCRRFRS